MNHAAFDDVDHDSTHGDASQTDTATCGNGNAPGEGHSIQEVDRLKAECERLTALVAELQKDRDAYLQALYHYLAKDSTREDIEASATMEDGVSFNAILQDMEQILNAPASSTKS